MPPLPSTSLESRLQEFLTETFALGPDEDLAAIESFLAAGVLDSTGILEVVAYLETEFEITVADEDIVPANLDSLAGLTRYVTSRMR